MEGNITAKQEEMLNNIEHIKEEIAILRDALDMYERAGE